MVTKKDLILAVIATFCLTATLFMIIPTRSAVEYDPWKDVNDDGYNGIDDIVSVAESFGGLGEPINKTALLYEVNATFTELLSRIDSLNYSLLDLNAYLITRITTLETQVAGQQSRISELETLVTTLEGLLAKQQSSIDGLNITMLELQSAVELLKIEMLNQNTTLNLRIEDLETLVQIINATKLGKPNYDSGWTLMPAGTIKNFTHNLNTDNVLVYLVGIDLDGGLIIHQRDYGGETSGGNWFGAYWSRLTTTTIEVTRQGQDQNWDYIRLMIWKIPES